jgi:hypothetical protein
MVSASIYHFLVLDPPLKAMGPIYDSHTKGLLYLLGPGTLYTPRLKRPTIVHQKIEKKKHFVKFTFNTKLGNKVIVLYIATKFIYFKNHHV